MLKCSNWNLSQTGINGGANVRNSANRCVVRRNYCRFHTLQISSTANRRYRCLRLEFSGLGLSSLSYNVMAFWQPTTATGHTDNLVSFLRARFYCGHSHLLKTYQATAIAAGSAINRASVALQKGKGRAFRKARLLLPGLSSDEVWTKSLEGYMLNTPNG